MKILVAIALTSLAVSTNQVQGDDRIDRLVEVTLLRQQLVEARRVCQANEASINVEDVFRASPQMFYGIGPRDERWSAIKNAYIDSAQAGCVPASLEQYLELARQIYQEHLPSKDLTEALRFYESEVGTRIMAASSAISERMTQEMYLESQRQREDAARAFDKRLRAILKKQSFEPAVPTTKGDRDS